MTNPDVTALVAALEPFEFALSLLERTAGRKLSDHETVNVLAIDLRRAATALAAYRAQPRSERDAGLQLANITHGMWSHAEEECDRLRGALGACERYALRIVDEAKARGGFSAANAEAIVRVCRENAPPVACAYCGTMQGLRKVGERPPDYICEKCFTPTDDGPCFDDSEPVVPAEGELTPDDWNEEVFYCPQCGHIEPVDAEGRPVSTSPSRPAEGEET